MGSAIIDDPVQTIQAENPQLLDKCRYEGEWFAGPGDEKLLRVSRYRAPLVVNHALKYTTMPGVIRRLDFSKFVHGEDWVKCYSVGG